MNLQKYHGVSLLSGLALGLASLSFTPAARANVYATDIQLNSTLTGSASVGVGSPVTLTYHLNDNATGGVIIKILNGSTVVSTTSITSPNAGTLVGLNTVSLTAPNTAGAYSVSIAAASTGYPTWQQITPLDANHVACYPQGLAVDKNAGSPYYGRVVVGCCGDITANGVTQKCGLYKYNADGTPADEGSFGYANYATNDAGITATGEMAPGTFPPPFVQMPNPGAIRIGEDDRIYWNDNSDGGAILACDILATTNQVIICSGNGPTVDGFSTLVGPNYANSPADGFVNQTGYGWEAFDIINVGTASTYTGANGVYTGGQAALFLCDWGDYKSAGTWMWHMVGTPGSMTADPTDTYGQQVINAAASSDTLSLRTDGIAVDYNLDLFAGEDRNNPGDPTPRAAAWTVWNGGVLPPGDQGGAQGGGYNYAELAGAQWSEGAGSSSGNDADVTDVAINSRTNPTLLARSHGGGNGFGLDLLVPLNPAITITSVSLVGTTLTLNFTSSNPYAPVLSQLSLVTSSTADGSFSPAAATFSGANGVFQAQTTVSGPMGFYKVASTAAGGSPVSGSAVTIKASGSVTSDLSSIDNTGVYYWSGAFDNVGNLYGANATDNYWRAWSPPGPNTNTTLAVVSLTTH